MRATPWDVQNLQCRCVQAEDNWIVTFYQESLQNGHAVRHCATVRVPIAGRGNVYYEAWQRLKAMGGMSTCARVE